MRRFSISTATVLCLTFSNVYAQERPVPVKLPADLYALTGTAALNEDASASAIVAQPEVETDFTAQPSDLFCIQCPPAATEANGAGSVRSLDSKWSLMLGGNISIDALYNSARPVAPGTPFFLAPRGPFDDQTFDIHGRSSSFYLIGKGPKLCDFETSVVAMIALYNDSITADRYGVLPYQAYGELKNEQWRFAGGLQMDIFAPLLPTVLPFSFLAASGNAGLYRGQLRAERFIQFSDESQFTITSGISDANPTVVTNDVLAEDNGWPNIESRISYAAGPLSQQGLIAARPFEIGVSTVIGQVRSTDLGPLNRVESNVWGVAGDFRFRMSECFGVAGEVFVGQGLGTYGGSVLQTTNSNTFNTIRGSGAWGEAYYYLTPKLHFHSGYGVDNPLDRDLGVGQVRYNDTVFSNVIYDASSFLRYAFEVTYRETDYVALSGNSGFGLHGQSQLKF